MRAFEELVAAHLPTVRRFARAFSAEHADDLAQEALLKAYQSIGSYRADASFSTWLYRITRNVCIDATRTRWWKQRRGERGASWNELERRAGTVDSGAEQRADKERLWALLRQLSTERRTALVLFEIEGFSYEEIAAIEQIPIGTVRSRIARARAELETLLDASEAQIQAELADPTPSEASP